MKSKNKANKDPYMELETTQADQSHRIAEAEVEAGNILQMQAVPGAGVAPSNHTDWPVAFHIHRKQLAAVAWVEVGCKARKTLAVGAKGEADRLVDSSEAAE